MVMMESERDNDRVPGVPSPRMMVAGLVMAMAANVLVMVKFGFNAGNLAAVLVCGMVVWLIRHRELFR